MISVSLFTVLVILVLGLIAYLRARNGRKRAEAEFDMACMVSEFQKMMLDGTLTDGDECHDWLYETADDLQFLSKPKLNWNPDSKSVVRSRRIQRTVEELRKLPQVGEIVCAYWQAFEAKLRYTYPLMFRINNSYLSLTGKYRSYKRAQNKENIAPLVKKNLNVGRSHAFVGFAVSMTVALMVSPPRNFEKKPVFGEKLVLQGETAGESL